MTTDEMFQLLITKFTNFEGELKELRSDVNRLEAKANTNHKELTAKIDANHAEMIERFVNQRLDIMVINGKIDKLATDFKNNRRIVQGTINDIQVRQENLEDDLDMLNHRLDKAS